VPDHGRILAGCSISRAERTVPCPKRLSIFPALHSDRTAGCTYAVINGAPGSAVR
jgi:hypothetical protein